MGFDYSIPPFCAARKGGVLSPRRGGVFCARRTQCRVKGAEGPHPEDAGGFCDCTAVPLSLRDRNCRSDGSSSQTPYPSLPRKRESSSIPLLVLSKTQTLRWFVFWFLRASVFAPVEYLTYEIRDISDLTQGRTTLRSRQGRRSATDAAHPLRVLSARRAAGAELLSGFTGSAVFYSDAATVPSATISFPSCGKRYGRKGRWRTK